MLVLAWYLGRMQRRHADLSPTDFNQFLFVGKLAGIGWFLHVRVRVRSSREPR